MPTVRSGSGEAWEANLKAEIAAGKPMPQALAIAYSIQRRYGGSEGAGDRPGIPRRYRRKKATGKG